MRIIGDGLEVTRSNAIKSVATLHCREYQRIANICICYHELFLMPPNPSHPIPSHPMYPAFYLFIKSAVIFRHAARVLGGHECTPYSDPWINQ